MADGNDTHEDTELVEVRPSWVVRGLYALLIGANLYLLFDWWKETPSGAATLDRIKAKAAECEGCAKRRAMLKAATNRMHWQATQIIEGESVETQPEEP